MEMPDTYVLWRATMLDAIARRLHVVMERLDPSDDPEWEKLTDDQREFYRQCVKEILYETAFVVGSNMPDMVLEMRFEFRDGHLHVTSKQVPGLYLCSSNPQDVIDDIIPAIRTLFKLNR